MMFIIKKIISGIIMPLPAVMFLLAAGLVLIWPLKKKPAGWIVAAVSFLCLLMLGYGVAGDIMLGRLENLHPAPTDIESHSGVKWVVVLGGGLISDPRMPISSQLSNGSAVRTVEGIRVYRLFTRRQITVFRGTGFQPGSGGRGHGATGHFPGRAPG